LSLKQYQAEDAHNPFMMTTFESRELYGGAITASLPSTYIDASDIRQIPDHQEVFLSNKTLSSLIFEINEYVKQPDPAALYFHFTDVIAPPDRLAENLDAPTKLTFANEKLKDFSAYLVHGSIVTPEVDRKAPSNLPVEWQQTPETKDVLTTCYQIVIRMEKHGTDFCVRMNIPQKELFEQSDKEEEDNIAKEIIGKIVETLDVKDFGLFGTE
jgi:hypothetical protein